MPPARADRSVDAGNKAAQLAAWRELWQRLLSPPVGETEAADQGQGDPASGGEVDGNDSCPPLDT